MADVGRLGQAVGQVTRQVLSNMEKEKARELQQAQIDKANDIINQAVNMSAKLEGTDETPFMRQKKVFKFIADNERAAGLPVGSALSSYKQFFGTGGKGAGAADPYKTVKTGSTGLVRQHKQTGKLETIFFPKDFIAAEDQKNAEIVTGKAIQDVLIETGAIFNLSPTQLREIQDNPQNIVNYPEAHQLVDMVEDRRGLETKTLLAEASVKNRDALIRKAYRDYNVGSKLSEITTSIIGNIDKTDRPLDEVLSNFQNQVVEYEKLAPKQFKSDYGDLVTHMTDLITKAHPDTKFDAKVSRYASKEKMLQHEVGITKAAAKLWMLQDEEVLTFDTITDVMRGVDPGNLDIITKLTGKDAKTLYQAYGTAGVGMGGDSWKDWMKDKELGFILNIREAHKKRMGSVDTPEGEEPKKVETEAYNVDTDPIAIEVRSMISSIYKPAKTSSNADEATRLAAITAIRLNPKEKELYLEGVEEMLDNIAPRSYDSKYARTLLKFRADLLGDFE